MTDDTEVISHIHQVTKVSTTSNYNNCFQCIRSRTICLRVKRKSGNKLALDLAQHSNVQDAFVIAVEQQARDRLEKLSALKKIKPVDMTKLSQQLAGNSDKIEVSVELNGLIESSPIYNISVPELRNSQTCLSSNTADVKVVSSDTPSNLEPEKLKNESTPQNPKKALSRENSDKSRNYSSCSNLSNGNNGDDLDNSRGEELELKQEIQSAESEEESTDKDLRPIPSTEVLLGTASQMVIAPDVNPWTKDRESLSSRHSESTASNRSSLKGSAKDQKKSSIKLSNEDSASGKSYSSKENLSSLYSDYKNIVMEIDSGPHREVAVDVPDTFIARTKTPPRYPPPKSYNSLQSRKKSVQNGSISKTIVNSRDSSKVFPKDTQITNNNVKNVYSSNSNFQPKTMGSVDKDERKHIVSGVKVLPTNIPDRDAEVVTDKSQLERIKKYQEDIRKRKQEEINKAKEEEILRNSLRNSKKLLALEQSSSLYSSGVENTAFCIEDETPHVPVMRKTIGLNELVDSLNKIYLHMPSIDHEIEESHLDEVENLLMKDDFVKVLKIHNKILEHWCMRTAPVPVCNNGSDLAQESQKTLRESSVPDVVELVDILNKFELVGLLQAHDRIADRTLVPAVAPEAEILQRVHQYAEEKIKVVTLEKTHEPLGATVRNDGEAVIIGRIVKGGAADKSGKLHEGDEILEVNTIEMRGKNVNEVCDILAGMTGTLVFLIVPATPDTTLPSTLSNHEVVMHVKAHFDYDPEDDQYIPCRELGISFQKGDILHVIKQDDPNWWQAYREGEEDQTLAGLIPSMNFQQQRETLKQTIVESTENKEKSRKGKLLCAKRQQKKKKKKVLYSANYSEECEDVLTYEEVALYYPRVNQKRPIVLIGPPNIGRHELRQKLMERGIDRFAAAVPHTSRTKREGDEVDGQDYHFISRAQFEMDIQSRKFVEHGEYEKAYYGTSVEAIRSVVNSGKICVLNLHPQSLKILKSSDLKPFVAFIAPPNLEIMKRNKDKMGANVKDEELKDIIEKAREIEENYGHYFDLTLINTDIEKTYTQLLREINFLEREPQWVPISWLTHD